MNKFFSSFSIEESTKALRHQLRQERLKREQAEQQVAELQQALAQALLLLAQSPSPILQLDATGQPLYANSSAADLAQLLTAPEGLEVRTQLLSLANTALHTNETQAQDLAVSQRQYALQAVPAPEQAHVTFYLTDTTEQRTAEKALAEQEEFYRAVLDELPLGVAIFDSAERYVFVNKGIAADKATREWMIGKTNLETSLYRQRPREFALRRKALFDQAVQERREIIWEEKLPHPAGPRNLTRIFRPLFHADGSVRMLVSIGADITEQRQAEEKLAQQHEFYESILNQLPTDVAVVDDQHRFLYINPAAISNPAIREWAIGKTNLEYATYRQLSPELIERREAKFAQMMRERRQIHFEETLMAADGPRRLLRYLHPMLAPDGSVRTIIIYGVNITERYEGEQKLAKQREFYESILNQLPTDIAVLDPEHRYLFVNPVAIKNPDIRKWIIGKSNFEYFRYRQRPMEIAEQRDKMFKQVLAEQRQVAYEETITTPEGPRRMLRRLHPVLGPESTVQMVIAYGLDITERHCAEQKLAEQREFYETILNNIPADIAVFDAQNRYQFVNPTGIKDPDLRQWIIGKTNFDYCAYRQRPMEIAEGRQAFFERIVAERR